MAKPRDRKMEMGLYVLDDAGKPQPETNISRWARWRAEVDPRIGLEYVGDVRVSTVFLGVDHRHLGKGPPILWETMIFGGRHHHYVERYTSRTDALAGHERAMYMVVDTQQDVAADAACPPARTEDS